MLADKLLRIIIRQNDKRAASTTTTISAHSFGEKCLLPACPPLIGRHQVLLHFIYDNFHHIRHYLAYTTLLHTGTKLGQKISQFRGEVNCLFIPC